MTYLLVFGGIVLYVAVIYTAAILVVQYGSSPTLMLAGLRRQRAINARAVEYVRYGHSVSAAVRLAEDAIEAEAEANRKAIEEVIRP